ncbi:hypothetical protein VKT23_020417 [Stygiomarasmius scandens]|uniref:Uncharacterized protein n=1 Tax=Marasmiellus scandens TaxID=2682957 RepID=A0ABR1IKC1_9AGAR
MDTVEHPDDLSETEMQEKRADPSANDSEGSDFEFHVDGDRDEEDLDVKLDITEVKEVAVEHGQLLSKFRATVPKAVSSEDKKCKQREYQRGRRARIRAEKQAQQNSKGSDSNPAPESAAPAPKRRKKSHSVDEDTSPAVVPQPSPKNLIAYIHILKNTVTSTTNSRMKAKAAEQAYIQRGPIQFSSAVSYSEFLQTLAKALPCPPENIRENTLFYKPQKPQNSAELPFGSEISYTAMITEFESRTSRQGYSMIIKMDPPAKPTEEPAFWGTGDDTQQPTFDFTIVETLPDPSTSVSSQKLSFDAKNAPFMERLYEQYPIGNNKFYPHLHVYTDSKSSSWNLDNVRLSVWASHMARGTDGVDEKNPPRSPCFDFSQRLKLPIKPQASSDSEPQPAASSFVATAPTITASSESSTRDRILDVMLINMLNQQLSNMPNIQAISQTPGTFPMTITSEKPLPVLSISRSPCKPGIHVELSTFCSHCHLSEKDMERLQDLEYTHGYKK